MLIVPYIPAHLAALQIQPEQAKLVGFVPADYATWLGDVGPAFTAVDDAGVVAVLGVAEEWEGRAQCWALLSAHAGRHLVALTRAVRAYFATTGYRRIEAQTPEGFAEGQRWLRLLGFEAEGLMRNYYPDGRAAVRYARCSP